MKIGRFQDVSKIVLEVFRKTSLIIVVLAVSYFVGGYIFNDYGESAGLFLIYEGIGEFLYFFFLTYSFVLTLIFTIFGGNHKHWWTGCLLIPVLIVFGYLDLNKIYLPLLLAFLGWLLGWGILKVKQSLQKNKTPIV